MTAWPVCNLYLWFPHEGSCLLGGVFGAIIMLKNTTQDSLWRKGIMLCFTTSQFMLGWKCSCFPSWITLPLCCSSHAQTTKLPPPYLTVDSCFGARMPPHKVVHIWAFSWSWYHAKLWIWCWTGGLFVFGWPWQGLFWVAHVLEDHALTKAM